MKKQALAQKQKQNFELIKTLSGPVIIGVAGFGAFYYISKAIDNIARAWKGLPLDNIQQSVRKVTNPSRGYNADGSIPTLLAVDPGPTYPEGHVRVDVPGWTGGLGSSAFILSRKKNEIVVVGNFNADATDVSQLSEGWLPYDAAKAASSDGREYVS
jgi:hypothetical protein